LQNVEEKGSLNRSEKQRIHLLYGLYGPKGGMVGGSPLVNEKCAKPELVSGRENGRDFTKTLDRETCELKRGKNEGFRLRKP